MEKRIGSVSIDLETNELKRNGEVIEAPWDIAQAYQIACTYEYLKGNYNVPNEQLWKAAVKIRGYMDEKIASEDDAIFYYSYLLEPGITKSYKVYGYEGHRQIESFNKSYEYDFSSHNDGVRILKVENSDITGTNEYTIVRITRNTAEECDSEIEGQITDGIFENCGVGRLEEI